MSPIGYSAIELTGMMSKMPLVSSGRAAVAT
jgi:hypothetical protein